MRIVALAMLIASPGYLWAIIYTIRFYALRQRMRGLREPELWLPKAERREHARKLLRREDEQWIQQQIERNTRIINER